VALEKLNGAFVLLGCGSCGERTEVPPSSGSRIYFPRVQPVLARLELANHEISFIDIGFAAA
jgi:hypothetical protein